MRSPGAMTGWATDTGVVSSPPSPPMRRKECPSSEIWK